LATNKIMSETLSPLGIPLDEMASNLKSQAKVFLRDNAILDQIGIHLYKYIFFKDNSSIAKELKVFLQNLHSSILVKQSIKDGQEKTKGLHFSGKQIMRTIDAKAGKLLSNFFRPLTKDQKKKLVNTEFSELDNFTQIGFSIEEFEHPDFGTHLRLKLGEDIICDSVPN